MPINNINREQRKQDSGSWRQETNQNQTKGTKGDKKKVRKQFEDLLKQELDPKKKLEPEVFQQKFKYLKTIQTKDNSNVSIYKSDEQGEVVVKQISSQPLDPQETDQEFANKLEQNKINGQLELQFSNCLSILYAKLFPSVLNWSEESSCNRYSIWIIFEKANCNLREYLAAQDWRLNNSLWNRQNVCLQVIKIDQVLRNLNICHCDLKLENFLVFKNENEVVIKLTDFGSFYYKSKQEEQEEKYMKLNEEDKEQKEKNKESLVIELMGGITITYLSPEFRLFIGKALQLKKKIENVDNLWQTIWSSLQSYCLGLVLLQIIHYQPQSQFKNQPIYIHKLLKELIQNSEDEKLIQSLVKFCKLLLSKNPISRIDSTYLLNKDKWLKKFQKQTTDWQRIHSVLKELNINIQNFLFEKLERQIGKNMSSLSDIFLDIEQIMT